MGDNVRGKKRLEGKAYTQLIDLHAAVFELFVGESDETGGDVSLVVGELLDAALVVAAAAARSSGAGAAWETATAVAASGLGYCANTHTEKRRNQVNRTTTTSTESGRSPLPLETFYPC